MHKTIELFNCDLNWSRFDYPISTCSVSAPQDWANVDRKEYFDWHRDFGNNVMFCQAYTIGGYAFYPTKLGAAAPHPGNQLFPRFYDLSRETGKRYGTYPIKIDD